MSTRSFLRSLALLMLLALAACAPGFQSAPSATLHIVSGSENQTLEPILKRFGQQNGIDVQMTYKGSLDIMLMLQNGSVPYDAIWPANALWISLGDRNHLVKDSESIMRSPVVLGIKRSIVNRLGWVGKEVRVQDILDAAEGGKLRLMMTSATQSNSGASAYFGFLYAFAGNPAVLASDNLKDPQVRDKVKRILGTVNRTSESSGFLRDLFLKQYDQYDAMFNYESLVIEMNQALLKSKREPLYAVYPVDGLAIADSPLAYINNSDAKQEAVFLKLQQYLLSAPVQNEILGLGRRVGLVGLSPDKVDKNVFNPDWGIDVSRVLNPIKFPSATVIQEALDLYQGTVRKPSFTVYCLDFSGSMSGNGGEASLKQAMRTLLDQQEASKYLLQTAPNDITIVLTFNSAIMNDNEIPAWTVSGNNPADLSALLARVTRLQTDDGTNIYAPVARALQLIKARGVGDRFPSVILMTDGQSNSGSLDDVKRAITSTGLNTVPVFAVTFGDASTDQLNEIVNLTNGRLYDGTKDLVTAFRQARGNN